MDISCRQTWCDDFKIQFNNEFINILSITKNNYKFIVIRAFCYFDRHNLTNDQLTLATYAYDKPFF